MKINFEYPLFNEKNSFMIFLKNQESEVSPLHCHPNYEMNFVIEGSGTRHVGNNTENFEEGDLILLAPRVPHRWENTCNKQYTYSSLVFQWQEEFLGNAWQSTPEFNSIRKLLELSCKGIKFDKYIGKEIKNKQTDLLTLPPFEKLVLLLQLLNELSKTDEFKVLCDQDLVFNNSIPNTRIKSVCQFVEERYSEKITLTDVASLVNMSEGAFSRFFSQATKKPFFSFLNEYRAKMACKLLAETDMRANEIGYACGYESLQFFYRQFLKYIQCSPQVYRKKIQGS
jgi:AraC-like DNA-binding protein/quercetin dioxygenase-like cupin family protein